MSLQRKSSAETQQNKVLSVASLHQRREKVTLPPKRPEDYSANWQALSEKLKRVKRETSGSSVGSSKKRNRQSDYAHAHSQAKRKKRQSLTQVWFDDIDADTLEAAEQGRPYVSGTDQPQTAVNPRPLVTGNCKDVTQFIAMDCEMVGSGDRGQYSLLARVSVVNSHGHVLYDTFVKPQEEVTDYRTFVSGVRASDLRSAPPFAAVQNHIADLTKGRTLVGHALDNDLKVLLLTHPYKMIRDTSHYPPFRKMAHGRPPSLRMLTKRLLQRDIQIGEHSSVEDARAAMAIYHMHKKEWEKWLRNTKYSNKEHRQVQLERVKQIHV